jgi:hypothetical protein
VARTGNKRSPGDVNLQAKEQSKRAQKPSNEAGKATQKNQLSKRLPAVPTIKFRINRESEWAPKTALTGKALVEDIRKKAGQEVANAIMAIRVFKGGDVKIHPKPLTHLPPLRGTDWIKAWSPSASPAEKEYCVVVQGVPVTGTAEEVADAILKENNDSHIGLRFQRASWLGSTGRARAALKISIGSEEMADSLIKSGVGLEHQFYRVGRWYKKYSPKKNRFRLFAEDRKKMQETPMAIDFPPVQSFEAGT